MDSDSQSELEKRLEGMDPASQIRILTEEVRDLRKIIAEIRKLTAPEKDRKKV